MTPEYVSPEDPDDETQTLIDAEQARDAYPTDWTGDYLVDFDRAAGRIDAALALHEPERVCQAHHNAHDCGGPWLYRCYVCAKTRTTPCRTWQILTGREKPDA